MTIFVHARLGHFLFDEMSEDGSDLPGGKEEQDTEEQEEDQDEDKDEEEQEEETDEDEVVVTLGGKEIETDEEAELKSAPSWVRELRKQNREQTKRIRELEAAQNSKQESQARVPQLGKKPTMEDDDVDYDPDKFEAKLTAWHETRREVEQLESQKKTQQEQAEKAWAAKMTGYETAKAGLKVKDFGDAEEVVLAAMDVTQQGIIVQGAENPALVVYALGKNPKKAAELAAIKDPIQYAFAIAKLETQLKVSNRKTAPPPEKTVSGNGRVSGSVDATLDRLRAEAERTGDMSKVTAYNRAQRQKSSK